MSDIDDEMQGLPRPSEPRLTPDERYIAHDARDLTDCGRQLIDEPRDEDMLIGLGSLLESARHDAEQVPCIRCGKRGHVVSECSASDKLREHPGDLQLPPCAKCKSYRHETEQCDEPREHFLGDTHGRDEALYNLVRDVLAQSKHDAERSAREASGGDGQGEGDLSLSEEDFPLVMRQQFHAWKQVAAHITPENAPILAAVLAEVARQKAGRGTDGDACSHYEGLIANAAAAFIEAEEEAMRLKAGGAA